MREQMDSATRERGGARQNLIGLSVAHLFRPRHDRNQGDLPCGYRIVRPSHMLRNPDQGLEIRKPGFYGAEICPHLPRRRESPGLFAAVLLGHPIACWIAEKWIQLRAYLAGGRRPR